MRVSQEQINAAAAGIRLARTAYLPHADALAQVNRATRNNLFGLMLPQSTIPSISGPVLGTNNLDTTWGTALGVLVSWEPFDFGLRRANLAVANALEAESEAALKRTAIRNRRSHRRRVSDARRRARDDSAAQAGVDRAGVLLRTITAQVNAQLRPGADASRADAELAAARTQWIQAQQAADVARATLSPICRPGAWPDRPGCRGPGSIAPGAGRPGARSGEEPDRTGTECRGGGDPGAAAGAGALLLSALLFAGCGVLARLGRGDQRKNSRRRSTGWRRTRKTTPSGSP